MAGNGWCWCPTPAACINRNCGQGRSAALPHEDIGLLALAFTLHGNFATPAIVGSTTMEQLKVNIAAVEVSLSGELLGGTVSNWQRISSPRLLATASHL